MNLVFSFFINPTPSKERKCKITLNLPYLQIKKPNPLPIASLQDILIYVTEKPFILCLLKLEDYNPTLFTSPVPLTHTKTLNPI